MKLELAVAGIGLGLAAAGAGTAFAANKVDHSGTVNKVVTIGTAALGAVGIAAGLYYLGKTTSGPDDELAWGIFGLVTGSLGVGSLTFSGGSLGADLLNWGN